MKAWNRITGLVVLCVLALVVFVSSYTYGLSLQTAPMLHIAFVQKAGVVVFSEV